AYLPMLVLHSASCHVHVSPLTTFRHPSEGALYSLSATLATASSQILCTSPIKTTAFGSGSSNRVYDVTRAFPHSTMVRVGPDSIFRRVLLPPQLSCCGVPM